MIFNMTGGGSGSGATLVVSCPANVTVTVSKDDKSYTKNSGDLGSAIFKGLTTGEWTVTMQSGSQTATKTITVTADYAITMAFFAAYINITYPANSNCVVQNSGGTTVASDTNTGSSTKTWTATVNATGTYTVTATATDGSGKTKSTTVSITTDGQSENVALNYRYYWVKNGQIQNGLGKVQEPGTDNWIKFNSSWNYFIFDTSAGNAWMRSSSKVDVTNYSKLVIEVNTVTGNSYFGLTSADNISSSYVTRTTVSSTTKSLDISSIRGTYYIGLWFEYNSRNIYNIYFE